MANSDPTMSRTSGLRTAWIRFQLAPRASWRAACGDRRDRPADRRPAWRCDRGFLAAPHHCRNCYFDGAASGMPIAVLLGWVALGLVLMSMGARKGAPKRPE